MQGQMRQDQRQGQGQHQGQHQGQGQGLEPRAMHQEKLQSLQTKQGHA
jgi:hypothetical protein